MSKDWWIFGSIVIGAYLRGRGLASTAIWFDEAYSLYLIRLPLFQMIRLQVIDFNPPLWEILARASTGLLGWNEIGLRLPSLLASIGSLFLMYLLAGEYRLSPLRTRAAMLAAAGMPFLFWMAQDGRIYAVLSMLYLAGALFARRGNWLPLLACCGLMLYAHTTGVFFAWSVLLLALYHHRRQWKTVLLCGAAAGLAFLPWVIAIFAQDSGVLQSEGRPFYLLNLLWEAQLAFWGASLSGQIYIISLGLAPLSIFVAGLLTWKRRGAAVPLALFALGPLVFLLLAAVAQNMIMYRTLGPLTMPLILWLSATLLPDRFDPARPSQALGFLWAPLLLLGVFGYSPHVKGGDLDVQARQIIANAQPGDIVFHATATSLLPMAFYLPDQLPQYLLAEPSMGASVGLFQTPMQDAIGLQRRASETLPGRRVWVVWARDHLLTEQANRRMQALVTGAPLVGTIEFPQAATIEIYLTR